MKAPATSHSSILDPLLENLRQNSNVPEAIRALLPAAPLTHAPDNTLPPAPEPGLCWTPVLKNGHWNLPTAVNMAAFSALAYCKNGKSGSVDQVLDALATRHAQPKRFGATETRMVLHESPHEDSFVQVHRESHFNVELFLISNPKTVVLCVQGTNSLLAVLLDSAKSQLSGESMQSVKALVEDKRPLLESWLAQAGVMLNTDISVADFLDHKTAILDYLLDPANFGTHAGFMVLVGAFLQSPSFQQAILEHGLFEKQVFFTGHSLGGALALLLARELQPLCQARINVYSFGCPRVGSPDFVRTMPRNILHYRVVNKQDPVAWMASGPQWKDHGRLRFLHQGKHPKILYTPVRTRDWPADHFIRQYTLQLRRSLLREAKKTGQTYPWLS